MICLPRGADGLWLLVFMKTTLKENAQWETTGRLTKEEQALSTMVNCALRQA